MSDKKVQTSTGKRMARAFVPKLTLKRAAAAVVPLCAVGVMAACSGDDDSPSFSVAAQGFDAGNDAGPDATSVIVSLAVIGFDAGMDADEDATPVIISLAVIGFDAAMDDDASDTADAADGAG